MSSPRKQTVLRPLLWQRGWLGRMKEDSQEDTQEEEIPEELPDDADGRSDGVDLELGIHHGPSAGSVSPTPSIMPADGLQCRGEADADDLRSEDMSRRESDHDSQCEDLLMWRAEWGDAHEDIRTHIGAFITNPVHVDLLATRILKTIRHRSNGVQSREVAPSLDASISSSVAIDRFRKQAQSALQRQRLHALAEQLDDKDGLIDDLNRQLQRLNDEKLAVHRSLEGALRERRDLEGDLTEADNTIEDLNRKVQDLTEELRARRTDAGMRTAADERHTWESRLSARWRQQGGDRWPPSGRHDIAKEEETACAVVQLESENAALQCRLDAVVRQHDQDRHTYQEIKHKNDDLLRRIAEYEGVSSPRALTTEPRQPAALTCGRPSLHRELSDAVDAATPRAPPPENRQPRTEVDKAVQTDGEEKSGGGGGYLRLPRASEAARAELELWKKRALDAQMAHAEARQTITEQDKHLAQWGKRVQELESALDVAQRELADEQASMMRRKARCTPCVHQ
ncbi:unnamed protein product [Vitrella brassicaformis CCMP3155]|uniref:Uncharacterized protein n=2 Tax=Vitrella brassicaformis TaxID=1169539 RepID=A0A0G4FX52_VITBC|nr:unnamed protein product [Vitrella brassicaformis CCMP3155]|eukprot:CEM19837.1 unnamed protein product [Vitrella brassicaformis CCMP3155]